MAGLALSHELVNWAAAALGWQPKEVHDVSWGHAESAVARLVASDGRRAVLKAHRQARRYRQECAALEVWAPSLPATPILLDAREGPPGALLMSVRPGMRVDAETRPRASLLQVHEAAGAWLQRLHGMPVGDDDPLPLAEALAARLDGWSRRAGGHLAPVTLRWVAARLGDVDLAGVRRVPCHRDFGPRNWLWDDNAGLEDAFWVGYGRRPDTHERGLADALRAMYAVGTVAWGAEHGDAPLETLGRTVLGRLGAPGCGP